MDFKEIFEKIYEDEVVNSLEKRKSIIHIVRENYDFWEQKLFPLWKSLKISRYDELVKILSQNGYSVSKNVLAVSINQVKKERKLKSKKGVTPELKVETKNIIAPADEPIQSVEVEERNIKIEDKVDFEFDEKTMTAAVFIYDEKFRVTRKHIEEMFNDKDFFSGEFIQSAFAPYEYRGIWTPGTEKVYQMCKVILKKNGMTPETWDNPQLWKKAFGQGWDGALNSMRLSRENFNLPVNFYEDNITGAKKYRK